MKLSVNRLFAALVVELIEGEVPQPLHQEFPLYALWADLARLAGEPLPAHVDAILDTAALAPPCATPRASDRQPVYRVAELEPA